MDQVNRSRTVADTVLARLALVGADAGDDEDTRSSKALLVVISGTDPADLAAVGTGLLADDPADQRVVGDRQGQPPAVFAKGQTSIGDEISLVTFDAQPSASSRSVGYPARAGVRPPRSRLERVEPAITVPAEQALEVLSADPTAAAAAVTDSCLETRDGPCRPGARGPRRPGDHPQPGLRGASRALRPSRTAGLTGSVSVTLLARQASPSTSTSEATAVTAARTRSSFATAPVPPSSGML